MAKTPTIGISDIEIDGEMTLWDVMRSVLRAKEARPQASVLPTMLVMKSHEVVAEIYQSSEEPRALIVRTVAGIRKISVNWYDVLLMLYRTSLLTLQKVEGSAVLFFGERVEKTGQATLYAMKWTARQFVQQPLAARSSRKPTIPSFNSSALRTTMSAGYRTLTPPRSSPCEHLRCECLVLAFVVRRCVSKLQRNYF